MVKKSSGFRSGTRNKLKSKISKRPTITKFLRTFEKGERVVIRQEPSSHKGMPCPRYKGRSGIVVNKRGESYLIEIMDGKKKKTIISRPEHLQTEGLKSA
jgi:large subunit ribosomal protein L21e